MTQDFEYDDCPICEAKLRNKKQKVHPECRSEWRSRVRRDRLNIPCGHCLQPLGLDGRYKYHPECGRARKEFTMRQRRRCAKCRKVQQPDKFANDRSRADGKYPWCMECQRKYGAAKGFQNSDDPLLGRDCPLCDTPLRGPAAGAQRIYCSDKCKDRSSNLRMRYGLSVKDYRRLIEYMDGKCPICKTVTNDWHVDHNHRTGETTSVVCVKCNVGLLAYSRHDPVLARALVDFLENTPAQRLSILAIAPEVPRARGNRKGWRG